MQTTDPDEAASCLRHSAVPYVSELLPGSPPFSTKIFITPGQRLNLSRVVTVGSLKVNARLPEDSYAVIFDLRSGLGEHRVGHRTVFVGPEFALVQSPLQPVEVRTECEYESLFIRIERYAVIEELERLLDQETRTDLTFEPDMPMAHMGSRKLRELCDRLRRALVSTETRSVPLSADIRQLESSFITLLLRAQPHNYRRLLNRSTSAGGWQLAAAEEFIRANAHLPMSLGDICRAAGVNARTLQDGFRKRRDCTPMEFLRDIRMEQARSGLLHPAENTSVAGEAARWGFLHFGRFSSEYRARYGELPSQTLRRSRQHLGRTLPASDLCH